MSELDGKFVELIEKFEALATELAPQTLDTALTAARVAAASQTVTFFAFVGLAFFLMRKARVAWPGSKWDEDGSPQNPDAFKVLGCGLFGFCSGIVAVIAFSVWPFVGIFYPELWIAKQVLGW